MKGWAGLVGWPIADGLPTQMVTHQLQNDPIYMHGLIFDKHNYDYWLDQPGIKAKFNKRLRYLRNPRDALCQLKCCPIVVRITQTDRVSAWETFSATVTFYSANCIVSTRVIARNSTIAQEACNAVNVINRLPYKQLCWCQLNRNWDQPRSTTTNAVDDNAYFASAPSLTRTTVADVHKFSTKRRLSQRLLDRSKDAIFTYPTCIRRPRWGDL